MATICRTSEGDLLDVLCYHHYGHLDGTVEAVLDANQGLASEAQPFRAGLLITLPEIETAVAGEVRLWD